MIALPLLISAALVVAFKLGGWNERERRRRAALEGQRMMRNAVAPEPMTIDDVCALYGTEVVFSYPDADAAALGCVRQKGGEC